MIPVCTVPKRYLGFAQIPILYTSDWKRSRKEIIAAAAYRNAKSKSVENRTWYDTLKIGSLRTSLMASTDGDGESAMASETYIGKDMAGDGDGIGACVRGGVGAGVASGVVASASASAGSVMTTTRAAAAGFRQRRRCQWKPMRGI